MTYESVGDGDVRIDMSAILATVWAKSLRILLVTIGLLGLTYGVLTFVPKTYESAAGILVEPRANAYTRAANDSQSPAPASESGLISSQIELIRSRDTLLKVIEDEHLRDVPEFNGSEETAFSGLFRLIGRGTNAANATEVALSKLSDNLTVIQERDSRIISVIVRSADPLLAARLANAIANAHVQRRAALSISDTAEASVWLQEQIETLRTKVSEAEAQVAAYKVDNDLFSGANNTSLLDQQLSNIATQITTAQERRSTAQTRARLIRGLIDAGQPIEGVQDVRDSVVIQQLSEEKARLQGERAQRAATLLPNHPSVRALVAQIAELDAQIKIEGRRVADSLDAEAEIEASLVTSLEEDLARLKLGASDATRGGVRLNELQREAAAQRQLLESYLLRYSDAVSRSDVNSSLPDVRVISLAAASVSPSSPKTAMILLAVGFVSLALQVGGVVFGELVSGRAVVSRAQHAADTGAFAQSPAEGLDFEADAAAVPDAGVPPIMPEAAAPPVVHQAEIVPVPAVGASAPARIAPQRVVDPAELAHLAADVALGQVRVVLLAGITSHNDCAEVAAGLVAHAVRRGLSVVRVDAGSGRQSIEPGLTDLAAEEASFGDVVHKSGPGDVAEVPWGQLEALERRSDRPATLIAALADIYEVVIVLSGRLGMSSALPMFAANPGRVVLVADEHVTQEAMEDAQIDVAELGFDDIQAVTAVAAEMEVA